MTTSVVDVIKRMRAFDDDAFADDYAKSTVQCFASDLEDTIEVSDKRTHLFNLLDEFRHQNFCDKNFSDCLDCKNHKECNAIRAAMELVSGHTLDDLERLG